MKEQNRTTWVSTSSFGDFGHPCPIFLSGKLGKGPIKVPSIPRFLHSLVRGSPRDSLGTSPLPQQGQHEKEQNNKAMSHALFSSQESGQGRTAQHGFLPLHSREPLLTWDFGHPCPIFLSGKIGQGYPILYPRFLHSLVRGSPEILRTSP